MAKPVAEFSREVSKSAKIWLSKWMFYVKNNWNLSDFVSLKSTNLGAHFLLLNFLITSIFKSLYFLKWCPIFDSSPLLQFSKFNDFLCVCWFLVKNLSNFVSLPWKLHNRYCHNYYLKLPTLLGICLTGVAWCITCWCCGGGGSCEWWWKCNCCCLWNRGSCWGVERCEFNLIIPEVDVLKL